MPISRQMYFIRPIENQQYALPAISHMSLICRHVSAVRLLSGESVLCSRVSQFHDGYRGVVG